MESAPSSDRQRGFPDKPSKDWIKSACRLGIPFSLTHKLLYATALIQKERSLSSMRFEEIGSVVSARTYYFSGSEALDITEVIGGPEI
jgi:hypothetical protein